MTADQLVVHYTAPKAKRLLLITSFNTTMVRDVDDARVTPA